MKECQELLQSLASQLIQKKVHAIERFLWSSKLSTDSEIQPSFWMTFLIKCTRYAIKLQIGKVVQTAVVIAERISYFVYSANKDTQFSKFGKGCLKLHKQMLILLTEDLARLLEESAVKQASHAQEISQEAEFRSGVMDISPRPNLSSQAQHSDRQTVETLSIPWIQDLSFLLQNLEMIKINLSL